METLIWSIFYVIAVMVATYYGVKSYEYREMAKEWKIKHDTLEYEVKVLRRKTKEER